MTLTGLPKINYLVKYLLENPTEHGHFVDMTEIMNISLIGILAAWPAF